MKIAKLWRKFTLGMNAWLDRQIGESTVFGMAFVLILLVIGCVGGALILFGPHVPNTKDLVQLVVTFAAAITAVTSLVVTAGNSLITGRRNRRLSTLAAYAEWSDLCKPHLDLLEKRLQLGQRVSLETVQLIRSPGDYSKIEARRMLRLDGVPDELTDEEIEKAGDSIRITLNCLERICVGVSEGVYDEVTLERIGGSRIVRLNSVFKYYMKEARAGNKNSRAYAHIKVVSKRMKKNIRKKGDQRSTRVRNDNENHTARR